MAGRATMVTGTCQRPDFGLLHRNLMRPLRFLITCLTLTAILLPTTVALAQETPLSLASCFAMALKRSESLASRDEDIRIAEAHYLQALGTALPHVNATASELLQDTVPTTQSNSVGQTFTRRSRPEVAITLTQPLFQGFREFRALKSAHAEKLQTLHQRERARQVLFADVARAYYTVLELEGETEILQSLHTTLLQRTADLKKRTTLGKSREGDLLSTGSELATNEADLDEKQGLVLTARDYLEFLTGETITQKLQDDFSVPQNINSTETLLPAADQRPDVQASREAVRLSEGKLSYEKGARYPSLGLEANYYPYRVGFQSDIDWDLNFALTVPIFNGGATKGKIHEAAATFNQSKLAEQESQRRAALEIRQAHHRLEALRHRETALARAATQAESSYRSTSREYGLGQTNNLDVLQSLRDWQIRKQSVLRSLFETKLAYLDLLLATGDLP